ncbi:hypothetical protein NL354_27115, partial [Klebsiella pneumoniae]|nr:hypothetical protein [Klebsiella pneumoniae]
QRYMEQAVTRLVRTSMHAPFGPVHVNIPFREPLLPDIERLTSLLEGDTELSEPTYLKPTTSDVNRFKRDIDVDRLAFLVGPGTPASWLEPIYKAARTYHIPIFADPLSGMRRFDHVLTNYDTWLASEHRTEWTPDTVVRFGAAPVSKRLNQWLQD